MKSIIAAGILLGASAPAFAGPYANVENNADWTGGDYEVAITEVHVGYEWQAGEDVVIYAQGGPAFISVADEDTETEYSGKVGIAADVTERLAVYGEVGAITTDQEFDVDELDLHTKVGVTFSF